MLYAGMTREAQKLSERRTLDGIIAGLGMRLDAEPEPGETPDSLSTSRPENLLG
jgi:hypothetical protein